MAQNSWSMSDHKMVLTAAPRNITSLCLSKARAALEADEADVYNWNKVQNLVQYLRTSPLT